jgi:hypothetical protein
LNPGSASGQLVYVGHGLIIKSKNINAYQNIDVKDKIVVTQFSLPKGITSSDFTGKQGEDWDTVFTYARKKGARGIISIPTFQTLSFWDQSRKNSLEKGSVDVVKFEKENDSQFPVVTGSVKLINAIFQGEKSNANTIFNRAIAGEHIDSFDLNPKKSVSIKVVVKAEPAYTQNVVGVIEGTDPVLKDEYIAMGAHYDHVGIGTPRNGDAIYNGADDDGSGTVALMAMAESLMRGPRPKRSFMFVWHAGEEKGLWGSRYITEYPLISLNQIITQLNIDMIGRNRKEGDTNPANKNLATSNEIYVIGSKMMSSELGELSEAVNRSYYNLSFNYKYDDPKDPNQFFFRSDHYNYARKDIPVIFYFDGDHEDYHRQSDSVDKIDFEKLERVTRTIYATAWELANRAKRPVVDKPLSPELKTKEYD